MAPEYRISDAERSRLAERLRRLHLDPEFRKKQRAALRLWKQRRPYGDYWKSQAAAVISKNHYVTLFKCRFTASSRGVGFTSLGPNGANQSMKGELRMDDGTSMHDFSPSDCPENVVPFNDALRKRRPSAQKGGAQTGSSYPPDDDEPPPDAA